MKKNYVKATLLMAGTFILLLSTIYAMVEPPAREEALVKAWGQEPKDIDGKTIKATTKDGLKAYFVKNATRQDLLKKVGVNSQSIKETVKGWTLLHIACYDNNKELINKLLGIAGVHHAALNQAEQIPLELYGGSDVTYTLDNIEKLLEKLFKTLESTDPEIPKITDPQPLASYFRAKRLMIKHNNIEKSVFEKYEPPLFDLSASLIFLKLRLSSLAGRLGSIKKSSKGGPDS